jgi:EAL domain-containing protein (putative c-di-GMP-specific phosphodiesterase class I)
VGIVFGHQVTGDADAMLQDASIAMVEAKRAGGSRHTVFEPLMQQRAVQRSGLESDLRLALTRGQFFVVYQPVVGLQGAGGGFDRTVGVEALVRWQHPQRGLVPPAAFIGVAEDCGLIGELGAFVLATACRQFVEWQATLGSRAPRLLAVNLSRGQLAQAGFLASVAAALAASGMPPAQLQLEVTESLAAQDEAVRASLMALKALGLTLALDDFGTGYSSLASLHLLPVDTVKIDRSFVSEAVTSAHHRVLIEATVRVARSLRMSTVAEGIETAGQAAVVRELGCEKGQGYLFSKPLSADELAVWLAVDGAVDGPADGVAPGLDFSLVL